MMKMMMNGTTKNTVISPNFLVWKFCGIAVSYSPKTLRKLSLSTKFPHQEIRLDWSIFRSVVFAGWLTDEGRKALFPARTTVADSHYWKIWVCAEPGVRFCWVNVCSNDNHYTTASTALSQKHFACGCSKY